MVFLGFFGISRFFNRNSLQNEKKMKFEMKKNENFPRFFKIFKICKNLGKFSFFFHFKLHFFSFCKLFLLKNLEIQKKSRKTISFQSFSITLQAISLIFLGFFWNF